MCPRQRVYEKRVCGGDYGLEKKHKKPIDEIARCFFHPSLRAFLLSSFDTRLSLFHISLFTLVPAHFPFAQNTHTQTQETHVVS